MPYNKFNRPKPSAPRSAGGGQHPPSYLAQVKQALTERIAANHAGSPEEAAEIVADLWPFVSKRLAESFWNGVSAGNRGLKPKARPSSDGRPASRDRGDNAAGD